MVNIKKKTSDNRNYLKEIIRTIIFLAKQGLPFRGHREDDDSQNKGNLLSNMCYKMIKTKKNNLVIHTCIILHTSYTIFFR